MRDLIEKGLLEKDEAQELAELPQDHVDYGALIPIKTRLLRLAASRFEVSIDRPMGLSSRSRNSSPAGS